MEGFERKKPPISGLKIKKLKSLTHKVSTWMVNDIFYFILKGYMGLNIWCDSSVSTKFLKLIFLKDSNRASLT